MNFCLKSGDDNSFSLVKFIVMMTIVIPEDLKIVKILKDDLPEDWNAFPYLLQAQNIGDTFVMKNEACILQIPSVVTPGDYNYLINPRHPAFSKINEEWRWDRIQ